MHSHHQKISSYATLVNGDLLAKNSLWNLLGWGSPLLVAVVAIPPLIQGLGTERFGILTLVWMVIGYFSLFDMGLGQALTKLVAERIGAEESREIPKLVWTAFALMGVFGCLGTVALGALSPWLVHSVLKIPETLQREALYSCYLLSASIPLVISTVGLCGVLEAYQRFDLTNAVRIPTGLYNFLGPLLFLPITQSLVGIVAVLVAGRILAWGAHLWLCLRVIPGLRAVSGDRSAVRPLLSFGSWMTVTSIISPLMVYMDRFLIGAVISMAAVAYYTTPYEVVVRLTVIPIALMGVLFPAFSITLVRDRDHAVMLFDRCVNYIFVIMFPITLVIVALAKESLEIWLGLVFAQNSARVLQWLAVGVLINSLAIIPFSVVRAEGRPDMIAKLHVVELPIYLLLLWWLLAKDGIEGAAIAWVVRVSLDAVILFAMVYRLVPRTAASIQRLCVMLCIGLLVLAVYGVATNLFLKTALLFLTLAVFAPVVWFSILEPQERHWLKGTLKILTVSALGKKT